MESNFTTDAAEMNGCEQIQKQFLELNEFQLALIGGGVGETTAI